MSAVFRPRLPAVECGLCVDVGKVDKQIVPLPALLLQPHLSTAADAPSSTAQLKQQLIAAIVRQQETDDLYLFDPEFTVSELFAAGLKRFISRQAKNCVARLNTASMYAHLLANMAKSPSPLPPVTSLSPVRKTTEPCY